MPKSQDKGRHGYVFDPVKFEKLDLQGQSRSINGTISHLRRAVLAHVRRAQKLGRDHDETLRKRVKQIEELKKTLEAKLKPTREPPAATT